MTCLICTAPTHRHACTTCITTTRRQLRELELYAVVLTHTTEPARGTTGRRQPGYQSSPPAQVDVLVMLDRRSRTDHTPIDEDRGLGLDDDDEPRWSLLGTVHGCAQYVRQQADHSKPRTITLTTEVGYLLGHIDWAATQPWIHQLAADIADLHQQARQLAHDAPRTLGHCLKADCTGLVFWVIARDKDGQPMDKARCVACGRTYTGLDLVRLGVAEEVAG